MHQFNPQPFNNVVADMNELRRKLGEMPAPRPLHAIASEINTFYLAALLKSPGKVPAWVSWSKPYQEAMRELYSIEQRYYNDSAYEIVLRCVCNLQSWRGPDAKRIKAELNALLKSCPASKHL